ncbi:MAG: helix-turn-helix domain-containing protein [Chthoniobacteraceae bacterium]|nr:helix-turn-helix domain-containing protein [Chthoniobacteraceae bacterium]
MRKTPRKTAREPRRARRPVVAAAFPSLTETELSLLDGIRERLAGRAEVLVLTGGYEGVLRQLAGMGELAGVVGDFVSDTWLRSLCAQGVKAVQLAHCSRMETVVNIAPDFAAMGRDAARVLRANGVRAFAFAGVPGQYASRELGEGFAAALGGPVTSATVATLAQMREFLHSQPRPLGLLAASDRVARLAVQAARELRWGVPGDVAVIGVGNARLESLYAGVSLSSFELPSRELGRQAAAALLAALEGGRGQGADAPRPVGVLHERESSLRYPSGLERALSYARGNIDQPLQVGDLCRVAGMSRRSLEMAMQSALGTSPLAYLQALRSERARTLLRTTRTGIRVVAQACGYAEPSVFSSAFRRWTGLSPSEYRKAN